MQNHTPILPETAKENSDSYRYPHRMVIVYTLFLLMGASIIAWVSLQNRYNREDDESLDYFKEVSSKNLSGRDPHLDKNSETKTNLKEKSLGVVSLYYPWFEIPLPPGEHKQVFQNHCLVCHSPQLVFNQPPHLKSEVWKGVVHKMVANYGANISALEEEQIVTYLLALQLFRDYQAKNVP